VGDLGGLESWDDAPAPANVGKKVVEAVTRRDLSPRHARAQQRHALGLRPVRATAADDWYGGLPRSPLELFDAALQRGVDFGGR
jgi:hypothetical protein